MKIQKIIIKNFENDMPTDTHVYGTVTNCDARRRFYGIAIMFQLFIYTIQMEAHWKHNEWLVHSCSRTANALSLFLSINQSEYLVLTTD